MQHAMQKVRDRCAEMVRKARELYGMDLSGVRISFDLKGKAAGRASGRGYRLPGHGYVVKFNHDMLGREAFDHVHNDTIPHEYAHVICFMNPDLGRNHDSGWQRVCIALGGGGARCHQEEVVYGKGATYEYITDRGHKVRVGDRYHRAVMAGRTLTFKHGKGAINANCAHSIVGVGGRTLAAPIVRKPAEQPDPAEMARRKALVDALRPTTAVVPVTPVAPVQRPLVITPVQRTVTPVTPVFAAGQSKAAISRAIMLSGYQRHKTYEDIIAAMMLANGYDRQLARATFKANAAKVGIPSNWGD